MIHAPADEVELLVESGADGFGARRGPRRAAPSALRGTGYYVLLADAAAANAAARALKGTLLDITDDYGDVHADCLVLDAQALFEPAPRLIDGLLRYQVDFKFDVLQQTP